MVRAISWESASLGEDLDADLGHEVDGVLGAPVDLGVAPLAAESLDLGHGHTLHTEAPQSLP